MPGKTQKQPTQALDRVHRATLVQEMNEDRVPAKDRPAQLQEVRKDIRDYETKPARRLPGGRRSTKRKSRKNRRKH